MRRQSFYCSHHSGIPLPIKRFASIALLSWFASAAASAAPLTDIVALGAGFDHACAVTRSGAVKCWGANDAGALGYGPTTPFPVAVNALGLDARVVAVAAGVQHTCALTAAGGVKCWGNNVSGQLGNGTVSPISTRPVDVVGLTEGVAAISAKNGFTCALTSAGGVKCWGLLLNRPGNAAALPGPIPRDIPGLASGVTAISVGAGFACALKTTGAVLCWGNNTYGQLGDGTNQERGSVVEVVGLSSNVVAIGTGDESTCALLGDGAMKCWGGNSWGQVGDGTLVPRNLPVDVVGLSGPVRSLFMGAGYTCGLIVSGELQCWGYNFRGEVSNGVTTTGVQPRPVTLALPPVSAVAMGFQFLCAVLKTGQVTCWGVNSLGQAGVGTRVYSQGPGAPVIARDLVVTEFHNAVLDTYFITSDPLEIAAVDSGSAGPGWSRTGGSFKSGGDTDVCRFYGSVAPGPNSHFYAADGPECAGLFAQQFAAGDPRRATQKSWSFEVFDFTTTRPVNGACPAMTTPVYRAYNNGYARGIDSNHRITTDRAAIDQDEARGWIGEGVVMCAPL